jgi:hypothetical protein
MACKINLNELGNFYGTEKYYRSSFFNKNVKHTDGVQYLASNGAGWLVDAIVSHLPNAKVKREEFLACKLVVTGNKAVLNIEDGNDNVLVSQKIEYTDFPEPGITLFFADNTIFLPSEN